MTEQWRFRTGELQSHGCLEAAKSSSAEEQQGSSAAKELCSLHSNSDLEVQVVIQAGQPALLRWSGELRWWRVAEMVQCRMPLEVVIHVLLRTVGTAASWSPGTR